MLAMSPSCPCSHLSILSRWHGVAGEEDCGWEVESQIVMPSPPWARPAQSSRLPWGISRGLGWVWRERPQEEADMRESSDVKRETGQRQRSEPVHTCSQAHPNWVCKPIGTAWGAVGSFWKQIPGNLETRYTDPPDRRGDARMRAEGCICCGGGIWGCVLSSRDQQRSCRA